VEALFDKAGIIRCYGRNELISIAGILLQKESQGKNIAIITHAGGPAVMLTDILSKNSLKIPQISSKESEQLLSELFDGSSVANPIDFLATGTAEQLENIIDHCENKFDNIDAMVVIFGSPGLTTVYDVYDVLNEKIKTCNKPIYAILPSVVNVHDEISKFIQKGNIAFTDEVLFGNALAKVYHSKENSFTEKNSYISKNKSIRKIIDSNKNGYLPAKGAREILKLSGVKFVDQFEVKNRSELNKLAIDLQYPVVQKVIGPLHKSDVGGVILNVKNEKELIINFDHLMQIDGATSVLIQPMISGLEIFIGAKKENTFPHIVMCGLGGIFVEVLKDIQVGMIPVSKEKALHMLSDLRSFPILKGVRGQKGINIDTFAEVIVHISNLLQIAPEITELDINPLLAYENEITAVDVRIAIEK